MKSGSKTIEVMVRRVRVPKEGRHGAVWKIAYADFVTALMAFFLLLWLLSSSSSTDVLEGVGNVFSPSEQTELRTAAAGGLFGGPGVQTETIVQVESNPLFEDVNARKDSTFPYQSDFTGSRDEQSSGSSGAIDYDVLLERHSERAQKLLDQIGSLPDGDVLEQTVRFYVSPEGIHLELIVPSDEAMFEVGSAVLTDKIKRVLRSIALLVAPMQERISVGGYSDSSGSSDANWILSSNRAVAARDFLVSSGIPNVRIENVEAYGSRRPQFDYDPTAPSNRRLTMTLLDQDFIELQDALIRSSVPPRLLR